MRRFAILAAAFACAMLSTLPLGAKNPYVNVLKLHGNVSCVKMYYQSWRTEFGEPVVSEGKALKGTLYYDKDHRLLYAKVQEGITQGYFFEYKYNNGILTTVDCYGHSDANTVVGLEFKIRLTKENNVTVGHLYEGIHGGKITQYSPYNACPRPGFWEPRFSPTSFNGRDSYFYVFAFEIVPGRSEDPYYYTERRYSYEYDAKKRLSAINYNDIAQQRVIIDYDSVGNVASIYTRIRYGSNEDEDHGVIYTFEYEYGNFETAEKFRKENYFNQIAREKAVNDSIAEAKRLAEERAAEEKRLAEEKAAEEKRLAEEKAIEQKWTQRMPEIKEFAQALTEALNAPVKKPSLGKQLFSAFKESIKDQQAARTGKPTSPSIEPGMVHGEDVFSCYEYPNFSETLINVIFRDGKGFKISPEKCRKERHKYSDDSGNYDVYCDINEEGELPYVLFFTDADKIYLVRREANSFLVFDLSQSEIPCKQLLI